MMLFYTTSIHTVLFMDGLYFQDAQEAFNTWIKDFHESKPVSVMVYVLVI